MAGVADFYALCFLRESDYIARQAEDAVAYEIVFDKLLKRYIKDVGTVYQRTI